MANSVPDFWINTNLNQDPYWEDYADEKYFNRILFQPGQAVQARELTQSQTILQKQISRLGRHIIREGSLVIGGKFSIETDIKHLRLKNLDPLSNTVNISNLRNQFVTGSTTTGLTAFVVEVADGDELEANTKTLFVRYTSSGSGGETEFSNNETLTANNGVQAITMNADWFGNAAIFSIDTGVVFGKGHFIEFPRQSIVLSRYNNSPNNRVGFLINEAIVDANEDTTLLDPASGSYNFAAPGADRLKLSANLHSISLSNTISVPEFTELFTIKEGILQQKFERTQYSIVADELAKRTFDESGDYYVNGLDVHVREHFDDGENRGYLTSGNTDLLAIGIEPGTAYIQGYELNTLVTTYLTTPKANTYQDVNSEVITSRLGNYVIANEFVGSWDVNEGGIIDLYDTATNRVSNSAWSTGSQPGVKIGEAKLLGVEWDSGTKGTSGAQYLVYLMDIEINDGASFSSVRSLYYDNASSADLGGDIVLANNQATLYETSRSLIYPVGAEFVRSIRDSVDAPDTTFTFRKTFGSLSIANNGTFSIDVLIANEQFPYGVGSLTSSEKREILVSFNQDQSIALGGTVSTTNSSADVTGVGTTFDYLNVGDKIEINVVQGTHYIDSIASNTSLTLSAPVANTRAGETWNKVYKNGDIIDFTVQGVDAGATRTVTAASDTVLNFDLQETFTSTTSASAVLNVVRTSAKEIAKDLRPSRFVKIDCGNNVNGTTGPYNLGFSDVLKIKSLRKDSTDISLITQGTNVASRFSFDNGQRDNLYEFASITPRGITLTAADHLLVELDYFEPNFSQGVGYFGVDSYPVNDANTQTDEIKTAEIPGYNSSVTGTEYDLRNSLDFRPVKTPTANDATVISGATYNPATSNGFEISASVLHLPASGQQTTFDYSFYLPRRDVVVTAKDGPFSIVQGRPDILPITPPSPPGTMPLATIYIAPFPSLSPDAAAIYDRNGLACNITQRGIIRHTMRDIGVMKERIENLEYYTAISLLEKQAQELLVLDENGLDRFKNGIFVDNFNDHLLGNLSNADYLICVDERDKLIRPVYEMESLFYRYLTGSGVVKNGPLITLEYTEEVLTEQLKATTTRNVEASSYRFIGRLVIDPETDVWTDTQHTNENQQFVEPVPQNPDWQYVKTTWGDWRWEIVGYEVRRNAGQDGAGSGKLYATTTSKSKAYKIAESKYDSYNNSVHVVEVKRRVRSGTEYFDANVGDDWLKTNTKLTDVGLHTYIRPQTIRVSGTTLKAGTIHYCFFDGEAMSSYVTPTDENFDPTGNEGDTWTSDGVGKIYGVLRLPVNKPFVVGSKEVVVTDNPTNEEFATSIAETFFTSLGLNQFKHTTTITSTAYTISKTQSTSETGGTRRKTIKTYKSERFRKYGTSCIAYSIIVDAPDDEQGCFVTSCDLYFSGKHESLGVWVEIREMDSAGQITETAVPYSESWYEDSAGINTSSDGLTATNFAFDAPVYLENDQEYALVVHTVDVNPDTYLYLSLLGDDDLDSGEPVTSRALTGNFYTTNNDTDWDIVPGADLKFKLYRAKFTVGSGTAEFGSRPIEVLSMSSVTNPWTYYGEEVRGGDHLTLTANTGGIDVTDRVTGNTSGITGDVEVTEGSIIVTSNVGFSVGEIVDVFYANNTSKGVTATVQASNNSFGYLRKYELTPSGNNKIYIEDSNGKFYANTSLFGNTSNHSGYIGSIGELKFSVTDLEPAYLTFWNTTCTFAIKTTSNAYALDSDWFGVDPSEDYQHTSERAVLSRSKEIDLLSGSRSSQLRASLSTSSDWISPVVDVNRTHSVYVQNIVNWDLVDEQNASGGNLINKYISRTVDLTEGNDAEDMTIVLSAYNPTGANVYVWTKIRNKEDIETFDSKPWIRMIADGDTKSSIADPEDWREYTYTFPANTLSGPFEEVQYTNTANNTFSGYKQAAVKVGLASGDSSLVPKVADLKVMFTQK